MPLSRGPNLGPHCAPVCPCLVAEAVTSPPSQNNGTTSPDPFECQPLTTASSKPSSARKTPESFLGPNAALVNLDSLVTRPAPPAQSLNPFLAPGTLTPGAPFVCLPFLRTGLGQALGPDLSGAFPAVYTGTTLGGMPGILGPLQGLGDGRESGCVVGGWVENSPSPQWRPLSRSCPGPGALGRETLQQAPLLGQLGRAVAG